MTSDLFTLADGREVELEWGAEDEMTAWTVGEPREKIGSFAFCYTEGASDHQNDDYYLVTNMNLEGPNGQREYIRQGIGREILVRVAEQGIPIVFRPNDGVPRDDGSHLTEMGPVFAQRMIGEGLASTASEDSDW